MYPLLRVEVNSMGKSLMIVDDSMTMRRIIMRTIRMSGVEFEKTEEAGNGAEALAKLKAGSFDVVLCDINMPEMTGIEMVKKLRTEVPERAGTKVIMVSTESSQELIDGVMADGANGYITKPFTPEAFAEKLKPLLN
jgi:two-component system, chemotaxis family, chemotaxis protein CheY